jgi:hypothetical protein
VMVGLDRWLAGRRREERNFIATSQSQKRAIDRRKRRNATQSLNWDVRRDSVSGRSNSRPVR